MTVDANLLETIGGLSGAGVLAFIVVGFMRGWIVTKREHDNCVADAIYWRDRAIRALEAAETAVNGTRGTA